MAESTIAVRGLNDLNRAFKLVGKDAKRELNKALRKAVEPIRSTAELNAGSAIPTVGPRWSRMRIGVTTNVVYVAPRERGRGSRANPGLRRPRFAGLLMDRAMQPALAAHINDVEREVGHMLDTLGREWEAV